jgi:DNA-binding NarL/FixJ family response regulator
MALGVLTPRETAVVEALSRGLTYANVAMALSISSNTVRHHVRSIYHKLAVASKTEAVLEALRLGVIRES